jgi:nitrate reductase delta subunit
LLLYPEDRNRKQIAANIAALADGPEAARSPLEVFLANPRSSDLDEYLSVLELSPPCPLYLGAYIFDEPSTCLGAGLSSRNGYVIEVAAVYRHFGFEHGGNELADFLPLMTEFLAASLERLERDGIGIRRRFVEHYVLPGLKPLRERLVQYDSPYAGLVAALEVAIEQDRALQASDPIWVPPARVGRPPATVMSFRGRQSSALAGDSA